MKKNRVQHLPASSAACLAVIARAPSLLLGLDLDGTLAPLRPRPAMVRVAPAMREVLSQCVRLPRCAVAIISGRSLRDLRRLVPVRGVALAANHGFEIAGRWGVYRHPAARRARSALRDMHRQLQQRLRVSPITGTQLEDKGCTLSVHFRHVRPGQRHAVQRLIRDVVRPGVRARTVRVTRGKLVLEVRPVARWGKGHAVRWLLPRLSAAPRRCLPVILGDDRTDEDAFRAFRSRGITVRIGRTQQPTAARYALASPQAVHAFLRAVVRVRSR